MLSPVKALRQLFGFRPLFIPNPIEEIEPSTGTVKVYYLA
jgi:hypothetical protein